MIVITNSSDYGKFKYDANKIPIGKLLDLKLVVTDTSIKDFRSVCQKDKFLKAFHSLSKKAFHSLSLTTILFDAVNAVKLIFSCKLPISEFFLK